MNQRLILERDDEAIRWAWRLEQEPASQAALTELDYWLSEDSRRSGALLRAQAHLHLAGAAVLNRKPRLLRKYLPAFAVAATLAALSIGIWLYERTEPVSVESYETAVGEIRQVPLEDGSTAAINTQSALEVSSEIHQRTINLLKGEAWFRVARDPTRPFVVQAGAVRVRALGTAFSVRRTEQGADVLVTEGTVETWVQGAQRQTTRMTAGTRASIAIAQPVDVAPVPNTDVDRQLAWRQGHIDLAGDTLAAAVAEFNRYNKTQLVITTPALNSERLYGVFRTGDPEGFANAVTRSLGASVHAQGDEIHIGR